MNPYIIVQGQGWDVRARGFQDRPIAVQVHSDDTFAPVQITPYPTGWDFFGLFATFLLAGSTVSFLVFAVVTFVRMS